MKPLTSLGELGLIGLIGKTVSKSKSSIGFSDDAAALSFSKKTVVASVDSMRLGTHANLFKPVLGRKAMAAALTDLIAKNAAPKYALTSLVVPKTFPTNLLIEFYKNADFELRKSGAVLVGGDTDAGEPFSLTTTVLGETNRFVPRSGAKEGDFLVLTGEIGCASAGYFATKNNWRDCPKKFVDEQLSPSVDYSKALKIAARANAGIDLSDGLGKEAGLMAALSKKKLVFDFNKLPFDSRLPEFCEKHSLSLLDLLFHRGEDYQVLYSTKKPSGGIIVGRVEAGSGVFLRKENKLIKIPARGYDHFLKNN
ncbi:thiamine-monophosphate kinase [Candidatus Micrarchaeota archaeon]|nr:thiamine-monophosphate kinase [Candidatus Micrarchaeota archaeon]